MDTRINREDDWQCAASVPAGMMSRKVRCVCVCAFPSKGFLAVCMYDITCCPVLSTSVAVIVRLFI